MPIASMTRRERTFVYYRLAGDGVSELVRSLQAVARDRLAEVEQVTNLYLTKRDELQPRKPKLKHSDNSKRL